MIAESRATYNGVGTRVLSVSGCGTPVILLHGYADSADTWRAVLARLAAAGRRALAVDLPGFGRAGRRRSGPMLPQFDSFADALLDDTGPAVLVGNSLGAATAVRAADRRPDVVRALVALDDPINARHWLARAARYREVPTGFWRTAARLPIPAVTLRWATERGVRRVLYGPGAPADPDVLARWNRTVASQAAVANLGRYALQYARETAAGHCGVRVSCPTVVVHGARDRIIPVDASRVLHQQIPGSELVVLPGSGHCPQLDDPDAVARLIVALKGDT
ncbi:alpha/beta fold hydrolase [Mycolicibacterium fluoranthenivorans]|uniref:Pimeloyl-ACP methyl ester carboxylesterase n=1 Tax=Mycolicibacterium fluoranthenivorans TaxID=258505 RepID=A0A7X5ZCX4_9MYCO|nr:alpha/beta hydrolase [Mycolicibacterium fluoranthenivorans]MCV7358352.1 alpha/beta hydrolase [Mycolicibacterium fluoranthenivorans]NIH95517.1 pimeloyl-ACP methyl ester carboxylesterase [Mycolicibacterium fluoranthenivorans]